MYKELHILEESRHLFWGLVIFVCTSAGTYLLAGSFIFIEWNMFNPEQLTALVLFLISFRGIFVLSEPLYKFVLYFEDRILQIEIKKGQHYIDTLKIPVDDITSLKFTPGNPRKPSEALFDFSTSYHLLYRTADSPDYRKLIEVDSDSIALKVDDIADIMRFVKKENPEVQIPREQATYFNL
ncbi:hypothetical protein [Fodinibius halophilus]|uniref:Uncharacterized protein n=1 Tax=Fodinibius halophilus TaxID=1736908 RepID=A0A6M1SZF1_9BACT|nr:hypothetical protein [Fodinibius halophilus]NGP87009.1 hypothetical protein [Fodinibius halophilus]